MDLKLSIILHYYSCRTQEIKKNGKALQKNYIAHIFNLLNHKAMPSYLFPLSLFLSSHVVTPDEKKELYILAFANVECKIVFD